MTNCSSFDLENTGHGYYFVVGAWLSKFCHGFSNSLGTFSLKMKSLRKWEEVFKNRGRKMRKNSGRV